MSNKLKVFASLIGVVITLTVVAICLAKHPIMKRICGERNKVLNNDEHSEDSQQTEEVLDTHAGLRADFASKTPTKESGSMPKLNL